MLPPEGRRNRKRTVAVAAVVGFIVAGVLTALAAHEPAIAGPAPQPDAARALRAP
jgi:hypothetical protein